MDLLFAIVFTYCTPVSFNVKQLANKHHHFFKLFEYKFEL